MTNKNTVFFQEMSKSKLWFCLLPELLNIERAWLDKNSTLLHSSLEEKQQPFLFTAITLWNQALTATSEGQGYFAAHTLRSILERVAFLWATSKEIGFNPEEIISAYEGNDRKVRRQTTDKVIDAACSKDSDISILYNEMLSRYFSHLSHLDVITISETKKNKDKLKAGTQILPMLLLFDVGNCLIKVIEHLLYENSVSVKPFTGGQTGHEFKAVDYIRIASYVMCEKHSRKNAIPLSLLLKSIPGFKGEFGITDIYRGGMDLKRFGLPSDAPNPDTLKGLSKFAIGNADEKRIVVDLKKQHKGGEEYEVRWPKEWDISSTPIALIARNPKQEYAMFDYITEFVRLFK
jgi:hypothetical protein